MTTKTAAKTAARRPEAKGAPRRAPAKLDRRLTAVRAVAVILIALLGAVMLRRNDVRDVDAAAIRTCMDRAAAEAGLQRGDENDFRDRFGLDPDGCEAWALYGSDHIMTVDELLVVKAPDADVRAAIEEAARARRDRQLALFRDYGTDQADLLEDAVFMTRGSYVFYGVSRQAEAWEAEFLARIR